ncbi:MAG: phosphoketolase family protein [Candidatus Dojkabacteria bacterium]
MNNIENIVDSYKKHHRLANYLSASMLYLKDNFLLEEKLKQEHIKTRVLGHWGTVPGLNFIYGGLNYIVNKYQKSLLFIAGPGHGAPAVLANTFLEGTLGEFYPDYGINKEGFGNLIKDFSWPGKFPSHTSPMVPGAIGEGGELGYSLGIANGAVMDNPDLTAVCVIGDGEAETATLATSWHSNKFINPNTDGVVLPILHLNGYKISGPTIFSSMSEGEILCYFKGLGYSPIFVNQYDSVDIYIDFLEALIKSFNKIENIKSMWNEYVTSKPEWPIIILKTKKGWTGPVKFGGKDIEDNNLSHGIPLKNPAKDSAEFQALKQWLESYRVEELIDFGNYTPINEIIEFIPKNELKMGVNKHAFGSNLKKALILPKLEDHELKNFVRDTRPDSRMEELSQYLRDVFKLNDSNKNFRMFSPDESESNLIEGLFEATNRVYEWPLRAHDEHYSKDGRIMEVLSENLLFTWMQGYTVTGRHGILISYEAFLNIVSSQIDQYIKYVKQWNQVKFRKSLPAFNLISTSTLWRQEHNGFTHQNPTLINSLLVKQSNNVSTYFPADVNTLLVTTDKCLRDENKVNLITACKRELPQWFTLDEARKLIREGYMELDWAGTHGSDLTLVSIGDYQTNETIEAAKLLKKVAPELGFKYVNINQLNPFGIGSEDNLINSIEKFNEVFGKSGVLFNFHGYPEVIKQLTWEFNVSFRLKVLGYIEEGTTTTPFDMEVKNKASRYHVCIEAIKLGAEVNATIAEKKDDLIKYFEEKLEEHKRYIAEYSEDMSEVR